jgi:AhpD family alkylhydroperoxidase
LKSFWGDFRYLMSHRVQIRAAMRSDLVTPVFRERLMMAVTEVNQCRYCRAFHIQQARQAGIPAQEITAFLKGQIPDDVPEDQKLALCYAQHWAENDADPEPEFQDQVREAYGEEGFLAIDTALRMIRMGNLMGNTWDLLLFRISFGKWGGMIGTDKLL